jgi:integrase/recombinase XerD
MRILKHNVFVAEMRAKAFFRFRDRCTTIAQRGQKARAFTMTKTAKGQGKRGQRKTNIAVPQMVLDRLTTDGLNLTLKTDGVDGFTTAGGKGKTLTLDDIFSRYYTARKAAGAANRTLEDYVKHMRWLRRFMALKYSGLDNFVPNREVIRDWISHMMTVQKLKPSTINIQLRTVKAMFNWAKAEGLLEESPFENIELLKVPEEEFNVLSKQQERRLLGVCDLNTIIGIRDALLISFLLDTGVRIGECLNIHVSDVNLTNRSVLVRGESAKTRKARTVYFGNRTQKLLLVYLQWHEQAAEAPSLFVNEYGTPLNKDWASKRIHYLGDKAGIKGVRVLSRPEYN